MVEQRYHRRIPATLEIYSQFLRLTEDSGSSSDTQRLRYLLNVVEALLSDSPTKSDSQGMREILKRLDKIADAILKVGSGGQGMSEDDVRAIVDKEIGDLKREMGAY